MNTPITVFRDTYFFLSNFYPQPIVFDGVIWQTSEHAYQAAKTLDPIEKELIASASTPGKAKRLSDSLTKRKDWSKVRVQTMLLILEEKFSVPELRDKLLETGDIPLIEGNMWGDTFWGVDIRTGLGENMLGKLLMRIRMDLQMG